MGRGGWEWGKEGDEAHEEGRQLSLLFLLPRVPPLPLSKAA